MRAIYKTSISTPTLQLPGTGRGFRTAVKTWLRNWIAEPVRKRRLYWRTIEELKALDDHILKDIGLDRSEIRMIARQRAYASEEDALQTVIAAQPVNDNRRPGRRRGRRHRSEPKLRAA